MLLCHFADFDERHWQRAFGAFVKANRSHWTGPPFEVVKQILEKRGAYEFGFQSMGTWTCRFQLNVEGDQVRAVFVRNSELPGRMQRKLDEMERTFNEALRQS